MTTERRRDARLDVLGRIQGDVIALDEPVDIRQISLHGLTIETRFPLPLGSSHSLRITLDDRSIDVTGLVIHTRVFMHGDTVIYISGLRLVQTSPADLGILGQFIEVVKAKQS